MLNIIDKNSEELVSRISYEIVKEVAPEELDLFDDFREEFIKNPDAFLEMNLKKKEELLGFAVSVGAERFFTLIILPVVSDAIKNYLNKKLEIKPNSNKIKEFRDDAFEKAISLGMDKEKAGLLADSIIGNLTVIGF